MTRRPSPSPSVVEWRSHLRILVSPWLTLSLALLLIFCSFVPFIRASVHCPSALVVCENGGRISSDVCHGLMHRSTKCSYSAHWYAQTVCKCPDGYTGTRCEIMSPAQGNAAKCGSLPFNDDILSNRGHHYATCQTRKESFSPIRDTNLRLRDHRVEIKTMWGEGKARATLFTRDDHADGHCSAVYKNLDCEFR